jgi:hypothetical protein
MAVNSNCFQTASGCTSIYEVCSYVTMDNKEFDARSEIEGLKIAQATQAATLAGAQATQAAVQAGMATTNAAAQAGTVAMVISGSVGAVVGLFLGLAISRSR